MNQGREIFKIMEKNQIIEVGNGQFLLNKLFLEILKSNLLKYDSVLDAIVFSIKSYLPESQTNEIALTGTFVITLLQRDYPEIAKEALDILEFGANSQVAPALESIFDSSEPFLPQSIDEILMAIKKYEDWK